MREIYLLKEYYIKYLRDVRKLSESSIKHYEDALKYISKFLVEKEKLQTNIYEIQDVGELEIIRTYLYNHSDFIETDTRGHRMYSAGLNNYVRFAIGEGFIKNTDDMKILDVKVPVSELKTASSVTWKRDAIVKIQTIEAANYECEINGEHTTFIAEKTGRQYMEGHHAIPMKRQNMFINSLDIYANIVCLCPTCHRMLHYGVFNDKKNALEKIYFDRADRLADCGIKLSKKAFFELVC